MPGLVKKLFRNQLLSGSLVLFIGGMVVNFANYLFHLLMGRMLGPVDYGSLTSLISLAYILSIAGTTLTITVVKFVTELKAKKDYPVAMNLFLELSKKFSAVAVVMIILFMLFSGYISDFLNLNSSLPVVCLGFWMAISLLSFINDGFLKGFLLFNWVAISMVFSVLLKLATAIILVKLGWAVLGAMVAVFISVFLPYCLSFYFLRFLWRYQAKRLTIPWRNILAFGGPVLLANLGLTSLYSTDIILVKHFFSAYEAGLYSALAMMGKIVFFASGVVPTVMFPLVAERFAGGKKYQPVFRQSFILVTIVSLLITLLYFIFPQKMIGLLYGSSYLEAEKYLGLFGIFISLFTLSSLVTQYFLSIQKTRLVWLSLTAAIMQIILICLFHQDLWQVIYCSLLVTALLLLGLLLCLRRHGQ